MASLLDALLGAGDADVGAGVVGAWNSDLGGGLQLQLLQLLAVLADDKAVVLLGDGDRGRRLGEKEKALGRKRAGSASEMEMSDKLLDESIARSRLN